MTEMAPLGTVGHVPAAIADATDEDKFRLSARSRGGRRRSSRSARATRTASSPWDGETMGELEVRGPWIAARTTTAPTAPTGSPTTAGSGPATS